MAKNEQKRSQELRGPNFLKAIADLLQNKSGKIKIHDVVMGSGTLNNVVFLIKKTYIGDKREILCLYALHAIMLLLADHNPYDILKGLDASDILALKTGIAIAAGHQYPAIENVEHLVSTTKATKNFTKSEMVTIKKSDVVIRQAVADNWEKTQQLLGQWPEVIEIFEREPLVRSDLKQYNGNLISQQELRSKLGCKDKTIFAKLRRAVQTKYPLSEKWFIRCQDQGNPIFFQVEHFDEYQQLWASVSQKPKAEVVKKTTKVEVVKETTKVEVVEEAAKVEVIEEPKRVDMLTVRGWAEFVGWLDVSCEQALQDTIDAEEEYKKAESEAHQSKGPSERAKLLVAACEKNQAVLDSTEEFNKKSADVEIAKALTKEKEQADEEVRKALEKVEQIKAKMNALMAEYGTYEM